MTKSRFELNEKPERQGGKICIANQSEASSQKNDPKYIRTLRRGKHDKKREIANSTYDNLLQWRQILRTNQSNTKAGRMGINPKSYNRRTNKTSGSRN